ncbi:MAG: MBL fold metallo-hydrolase [Curvibacter sp.]|nr:MAG: MBL fold metallo-hydrolase [Curvibacter sp.]
MPLSIKTLQLPRSVLLGIAILLVGCASVNPYYDATKKHHRPDGFNNNYIDNWRADQPSFFAWQRERWTKTLPPQDPARVRVLAPDLAYLNANRSDVSVTWVGHSTALWQLGGLNILTDPHFTERSSPVSFAGPKREVPLPMQLSALPRIDVVLISHNHYDHLDARTVRMLNEQPGGPPLFIVPLGLDLWMKAESITNVHRMDWWETFRVKVATGEVTIHFVPVQHWSSRTPWDRNATLWGGFVAQAEVNKQPYSMFFSGDTGYSKDFADIGARFGGFDFSQIAVGCYLPRWFMQEQHVNEEDAVRIHLDVKSKLSMGVHWGTFRLCDDAIDAPIDELPKARRKLGVADDAFLLFALGETRVLARGLKTQE